MRVLESFWQLVFPLFLGLISFSAAYGQLDNSQPEVVSYSLSDMDLFDGDAISQTPVDLAAYLQDGVSNPNRDANSTLSAPRLRRPSFNSPGQRSSGLESLRSGTALLPEALSSRARRDSSYYSDQKLTHVSLWTDSPIAGLTATINDGLIARTNVPLAGGARRLRMGDNNRALPVDRAIFEYQYFKHAYTADASRFIVGPDVRRQALQQFTVGMEKTFLHGRCSVDVRIPFANQFTLNTPNFGVEGGTLGNINCKFKMALLIEDNFALSIGTGIDIPTGDGVLIQGNGVPFEIQNTSTFLAPFVAYEERLNDYFVNAFLSADIPLSGNDVRFGFPLQPTLGKINDQTLFICNLGAGRWLYRNDQSRVRGWAVASELNYTSTTQNSDIFVRTTFLQQFTIRNDANRVDALNLTLGTQFNIAKTELRLAFVQPLRNGDDRAFTNELSFQANRHF